MSDPTRFAFFLAASAALIVVPGPAVLYIIARSLSQGRRAGLVSMLGIGLGNSVHALAAALGLAALIRSSPLAFGAVKYLGAAYLVYLGIRKLFEKSAFGAESESASREGAGKVFRDAFVIAVTNPKTALFFLAFLPQFADRRGALVAQMLFLGFTFVSLAMLSDSSYALLAGSVRSLFGKRPQAPNGARFVTAAVFISLGVVAAMASVGSR